MFKLRYLFITKREKLLINELLFDFSRINFIDTHKINGAILEWSNNLNELKINISKKNILKFLRWDVIKRTMFVDNSTYVQIEYQSVLNNFIYKDYWFQGIKENKIGYPYLRTELANTSGNLIHHLYHLTEYYNFSNKKPNDFEVIFEFGGGYGSMCRLIHNLNFQGKYIIFDFPHFIALQKFYLKSAGYNIYDYKDYNKVNSGIFLISDINDLEDICKFLSPLSNSLFIATWSLSETNLTTRNLFNNIYKNFNHFIIAFQDSFGEVHNMTYFNEFNSSFNNITFLINEIKHLPANFYNFGKVS